MEVWGIIFWQRLKMYWLLKLVAHLLGSAKSCQIMSFYWTDVLRQRWMVHLYDKVWVTRKKNRSLDHIYKISLIFMGWDGTLLTMIFFFSVYPSGTEQERSRPSRMQQPLPDPLPESSSSSAQSSRRGSEAAEESVEEEQVVGRVAVQLRTIGDEMNAVYLQRRVRIQFVYCSCAAII